MNWNPDLAELLGEYVVPVDPMDELGCDSCQ
ncbi:ribonucleotide-diphosphate reductase subunit beta [Planctomonas sp. JC2975]|nr:ribonucleotide-diphosphate reductase subunit beta [Planctomonas sp. JC2975]NNC14082.1 ribonucleotide-diphosphate reductase subunit beta [Planctomonas sp. JC2975]